jgi:hypothetical protein
MDTKLNDLKVIVYTTTNTETTKQLKKEQPELTKGKDLRRKASWEDMVTKLKSCTTQEYTYDTLSKELKNLRDKQQRVADGLHSLIYGEEHFAEHLVEVKNDDGHWKYADDDDELDAFNMFVASLPKKVRTPAERAALVHAAWAEEIREFAEYAADKSAELATEKGEGVDERKHYFTLLMQHEQGASHRSIELEWARILLEEQFDCPD